MVGREFGMCETKLLVVGSLKICLAVLRVKFELPVGKQIAPGSKSVVLELEVIFPADPDQYTQSNGFPVGSYKASQPLPLIITAVPEYLQIFSVFTGMSIFPATPVPGELGPITTCPPEGIRASGTFGILIVNPEIDVEIKAFLDAIK